MAPSQMGMWQGSLEVFCGPVLNKKSSLPTKKKEKKRGLDLRSPNTVASPSSMMPFNTFLYTPELLINTHLHLLPPLVIFTPISHPSDTCYQLSSLSPPSETICVITFSPHSRETDAPCNARHRCEFSGVGFFGLFFFLRSLFRCGNLIFSVPLRRGNGHKGGEVKVQSPRLGGL